MLTRTDKMLTAKPHRGDTEARARYVLVEGTGYLTRGATWRLALDGEVIVGARPQIVGTQVYPGPWHGTATIFGRHDDSTFTVPDAGLCKITVRPPAPESHPAVDVVVPPGWTITLLRRAGDAWSGIPWRVRVTAALKPSDGDTAAHDATS